MHLDILNIFNILITPTPSTWCTLQKENALIKLKTWICPIKIFNFNIDVRTLKFILISERYFTGAMAGTFVRFLRMTLHLFCSQLNPSLSLSAPWSTAYLDVALICSAFKAFFTFTFLCRNSTAPTPPPWFTSYSDVPLHSTLFAVYRFFLSIEKLSPSASPIVPVFKVFLQVKVSEQNCNQSSIGIFLFFPFCSFAKIES